MPGKKKIRTPEYIKIYNLLYRKIRNSKTNLVNELGKRNYRKVNIKHLVEKMIDNNLYRPRVIIPKLNKTVITITKNNIVYL